jgi:hypothetical protein
MKLKISKDSLFILVIFSYCTGIISLFFPQWYSGIFIALNESLVLAPNVREMALALSLFSLSFLILSIIGLIKSIKMYQKREIYYLWAIWVTLGTLIIITPIIHLTVCYNLCIDFSTYSIFGIELIFSFSSGIMTVTAGLLNLFSYRNDSS